MSYPTLQPATTRTVAGSRPDPYAAVHAALRRCMADTLARLGTLRTVDAHELGVVVAQVRELLTLLRRHALIENQFIHPAIEAVSPGATRGTQDDHQEHPLAIGELLSECDRLGAQPDAGAIRHLRRQLARLVTENLTHMHDEETRLGPLLLAGTSEAELAAIEQRAAATVAPAERAALMRWLSLSLARIQPPGCPVGLCCAARAATAAEGDE